MEKRIIAHLDMDAFFAAVEEREKPHLKGLPIVVGCDPMEGKGRGVVSTANYLARKYGIHSALPIARAWQFSQSAKKEGKPEVVFLEPNIKKYSGVSQKIFEIIRKYSLQVEESSIDEAYFDLSFVKSFKQAESICQKIKNEIKEKEKLTASIGIGPNKLIAKLASDFQKPDGLTVIGTDDKKKCTELVEIFLNPLPIRKIPGIGPKTEIVLKNKGINFVKDLKNLSKEKLKEMLGKWGADLYDMARGRDNSPIIEEYEIKSIGEHETFLKDTKDAGFLFQKLNELAENIINRFNQGDFRKFKAITLTVRFADFETKTSSKTLSKPINSLDNLKFEALKLLTPFLSAQKNPRKKLIRLIGLRIEKLE